MGGVAGAQDELGAQAKPQPDQSQRIFKVREAARGQVPGHSGFSSVETLGFSEIEDFESRWMLRDLIIF